MSSTARPTVIFHTKDLGPAIQAETINSHLLEPSTSKENSCVVKIEIKTEETEIKQEVKSENDIEIKQEVKSENDIEIKQEVKSENDIEIKQEVKSEEVEGVNFELVPKVESTCSYSSSNEDEWGDGHVLEISVVERFKLRECTVTLERWHPKLRRSRRVLGLSPWVWWI
ncbi:unnamed protein product [Bemisia tabaci]|uniref:Uncharacterized protein n=1 Tax=Bemisia tabaci TaxID=7038 RepID=A0A9P0AGH3_BEMTA|nr:unnamed protein product [Bemisia tabaci]